MDLKALFADFGLGQNGLMIAQVFTVVFITLLANFVALKLLARVISRLHRTETFWDDVFVMAARKPLSLLIWVIGVSWAADIVAVNSGAAIFEAVDPVRDMLVILILVWFIVSFIKGAENELTSPDHPGGALDATTVMAMGKLLRLSVIITAALVLLQTLGYSISGILAFGGIGGIAIGFAAKDLLANFFGGLMIYLDRPFAVGDWVRSPDREIEGTVEDIGWRLTRIRTFDKRPLYIPNATFASITVENPSRMTNRRIYETIGLRYQDAGQLADVIATVKKMLQQHPEIDTEKTLIVNFNAYGASSLDFFIYTFTKTTDWIKYHEVKQDVLLKILSIIADHGADVAYPTSTVHLPDALKLDREPPVLTDNNSHSHKELNV